MARIMGIDYGLKRTGMAVTDVLQISVNPLDTLSTDKVSAFLKSYLNTEDVEKIVIGHPEMDTDRTTTISTKIEEFKRHLEKKYPKIFIALHCEAYTSVRAREIILQAGVKQKKRRDKALVDKVSAVLILQDYLGHI